MIYPLCEILELDLYFFLVGQYALRHRRCNDSSYDIIKINIIMARANNNYCENAHAQSHTMYYTLPIILINTCRYTHSNRF
jgi:hypothetical protein